jgi:hypothetical protein
VNSSIRQTPSIVRHGLPDVSLIHDELSAQSCLIQHVQLVS